MALQFYEFEGKEYILKEDHESSMREKIKEVTDKKKEVEKQLDEQLAQLKSLTKELEQKSDLEKTLSKYQNKLALSKMGASENEDDLEQLLGLVLAKANEGREQKLTADQFIDELKGDESKIPTLLKPFWKKATTATAAETQEPVAIQQPAAQKLAANLATRTVPVPQSQPEGGDPLLEKARRGEIKFSEAYAQKRGVALPEKKEEK